MMRTSVPVRSIRSTLANSAAFSSHFFPRSYCTGTTAIERKVAILGAAGGIGQPLSLLTKLNPLVSRLALYDIAGTPVSPLTSATSTLDLRPRQKRICLMKKLQLLLSGHRMVEPKWWKLRLGRALQHCQWLKRYWVAFLCFKWYTRIYPIRMDRAKSGGPGDWYKTSKINPMMGYGSNAGT